MVRAILIIAVCLMITAPAVGKRLDTDNNEAVDIVSGGTNATTAQDAIDNLTNAGGGEIPGYVWTSDGSTGSWQFSEGGDFSPASYVSPATDVSPATSFDLIPLVGEDSSYARQDHNHGTPKLDVPFKVSLAGVDGTAIHGSVYGTGLSNEYGVRGSAYYGVGGFFSSIHGYALYALGKSRVFGVFEADESIEIGHPTDTTISRIGVGDIGVEANRLFRVGGADVPLADGGTGQSTAQDAINALTQVSGATNEYVLTKDTATGDAVFKAASSVEIPVAISDGGTGQTTAQDAINALTQVSGASNEYVLTKDTATGNAVFKASTTVEFPGGSDTSVQFNDSGGFGGDSGFVYDKLTGTLTITGAIIIK